MSLNKKQKVAVCCHVARGVRIELPTSPKEREARLLKLAETPILQDDLKEYNRMVRLGLDELNPIFEKALVILEDVPEELKKNHLGLDEAEMRAAKADGKIVYKPQVSEDGKHLKTTDGTVYAKQNETGTIKRVTPKPKETKREKRLRRRKERIAAGKGR